MITYAHQNLFEGLQINKNVECNELSNYAKVEYIQNDNQTLPYIERSQAAIQV